MSKLITDQLIAELFQEYKKHKSIAIAVSGGADSVCLMLMMAKWLKVNKLINYNITILSVNHKLRQEADYEVAKVKEWANECNFSHRTLIWKGEKPKTGIQNAARKARYSLMLDWCRKNGYPCLLVAHTMDDQAETFLMRLARGSGIDGLAAMPFNYKSKGIIVCRPLLSLSRKQITSYLKDNKQNWLEDPSNQDERYERVRIRNKADTLKELGLGCDKIYKSAQNIMRAQQALEYFTHQLKDKYLSQHNAGFFLIDKQLLAKEPEEICFRIYKIIISSLVDIEYQVGNTAISRLHSFLKARKNGQYTLGKSIFHKYKKRIYVYKEISRLNYTPVKLKPGSTTSYDKRFSASLEEISRTLVEIEIAYIGQKLQDIPELLLEYVPDELPKKIVMSIPAIFNNSKILAVPSLNYYSQELPKDYINIDILKQI